MCLLVQDHSLRASFTAVQRELLLHEVFQRCYTIQSSYEPYSCFLCFSAFSPRSAIAERVISGCCFLSRALVSLSTAASVSFSLALVFLLEIFPRAPTCFPFSSVNLAALAPREFGSRLERCEVLLLASGLAGRWSDDLQS